MKLLLLLPLLGLVLADEAFVPEKQAETNDVPQQQASPELEAQPNIGENGGDKKVGKRSYGYSPWGYGGYGHGWPWYGHGFYGGWYPGWPTYYFGHGYGGYIGYRGLFGHGGWYKGW